MAGRAPGRASRRPLCATCTITAPSPSRSRAVKVAHSHHASNNPKAYYKKRFTVEDVLNSRFICKPLHLLDCCVETDNAHLRSSSPRPSGRRDMQAAAGADPRRRRPLQQAAPRHALPARADLDRRRLLRQAKSCGRMPGSGPEDIDITGSYDAFTFTTMLQLEDYGFCKKGEGGEYVVERRDPRSAAGGPTTPAAAISARATPTA